MNRNQKIALGVVSAVLILLIIIIVIVVVASEEDAPAPQPAPAPPPAPARGRQACRENGPPGNARYRLSLRPMPPCRWQRGPRWYRPEPGAFRRADQRIERESGGVRIGPPSVAQFQLDLRQRCLP